MGNFVLIFAELFLSSSNNCYFFPQEKKRMRSVFSSFLTLRFYYYRCPAPTVCELSPALIASTHGASQSVSLLFLRTKASECVSERDRLGQNLKCDLQRKRGGKPKGNTVPKRRRFSENLNATTMRSG